MPLQQTVSPAAASPLLAALSSEERSERRHALVERMLADVVGIPWEAVHREADRWGDDVSDAVEAHLTSLLGDPGTCPHGNPIPGSANVPDQSAAVRLSDAELGPVRVVRISEAVEDDDAVMARLAAAGFTPAAECEVVAVTQDGAVDVAGAVADTSVPPHAAREIWVELV